MQVWYLPQVIITTCLDITRSETGFLEHVISPLERTIKIIDSVISHRPHILTQFPGLFYSTASDGGKQANKASHHYTVEKYRFWGIDGTCSTVTTDWFDTVK